MIAFISWVCAALLAGATIPPSSWAQTSGGQNIPATGNPAVGDRPGSLEGNWRVEWHDYPKKGEVTRPVAVITRRWERKCIDIGGQGCRSFNRVHPAGRALALHYSQDLVNWNNTGSLLDQPSNLEIQWGSRTLGEWGGRSKLQPIGPNELRGRWSYGDTGGPEIWRRASPRLSRVVFTSNVKSEVTPSGGAGRVETTDGSASKFNILVYGENLWGLHLVDVGGALDLEPRDPWGAYLMKGGGTYASMANKVAEVVGIQTDVLVGSKARPGRKVLRVDGIVIPFDLTIKGRPGTAVDETTEPGATTAIRPGTGAPRESTRITRVSLAFADRVVAWKTEVKTAASAHGRLLRRKEALENTAREAGARAERALKAAAELPPLIERAELREQEMLTFLERLRAGERKPPTPKARAAVQGLGFLEKDIRRLEDEIERGRASGQDISAPATQLARRRQQQRDFERDLNEQFRDDATGQRLLADFRKRQDVVLALRRKEAALVGEQRGAEAELHAAVSERLAVDTKLLELAEILAGFDPAIQAVIVEADRKKVFHAVSGVKLGPLIDINTRIAESEQALAPLDRRRRIARDQFFTAANEASASEARLADELYNLAWRRFVVDLGFDTVDVMQGMAKSGIIGAATELGKKIVERRAFPLVSTPGVDPGSVEAEINALYGAQLKDATSGVSLARVAAERGIKDLVLKRGKDTLNKKLGALVFDKLEAPWRVGQIDQTILKARATRDPSVYLKATKQIERLQAQHDSIRKGFKHELKDAGKSIFKDALKTTAKAYLDSIERAVWTDFIEKDVAARLAFPLHQISAHYYWEAFDNHEALLQEKAAMLEGLDVETGLKTTVSETFARKAGLRVTLDLVVRRGGRDDIEVLVGGLRATRAGNSRVYEVRVEEATIDEDGTLSLVLR